MKQRSRSFDERLIGSVEKIVTSRNSTAASYGNEMQGRRYDGNDDAANTTTARSERLHDSAASRRSAQPHRIAEPEGRDTSGSRRSSRCHKFVEISEIHRICLQPSKNIHGAG